MFYYEKEDCNCNFSLLCAVIIAAGAFCGYQARQLWKSRQAEQTYGERALREMSESLNALNEALRESAYATDPVLYSR